MRVMLVAMVCMFMTMVVAMIVIMLVFVGVGADFHVANAEAAAAFFTHIILVLRRRFLVPAPAANRRLDCGSGDIH